MTQRLLAFDTSGFSCSAALWRNGEVVASHYEPMERGQAERLLPMIEGVMADAGESYAGLDLIAVTRGPGAFTGLRLGLATARALGLAAGCPVLGVSVFEALYNSIVQDEQAGRRVLVSVESKREDLYLQLFDETGAMEEPKALLPQAAALRYGDERALDQTPLLLVGNGAERLAPAFPSGSAELCAVIEAQAAGWADWAARQDPPALTDKPQPLYMRPPDVSFPKNKGRPNEGGGA